MDSILLEKLYSQFAITARHQHLEYGMTVLTDRMINDWVAEYEQVGYLFLYILVRSTDSPSVLTALLKGMAQQDYAAIFPYSRIVGEVALLHTDLQVIEGAIRAFEHWESEDGILFLTNLAVGAGWLEKYRVSTLDLLKRLHKR